MRVPSALTAAAAMVVVGLLVTGCGGSAEAGDVPEAGYVAGDGSIVLIPPDQRAEAPAVVGPTLDAGTFSLSDHRGEVVVINVWASWCAPCRAEAPTLAALAEELQSQGVTFVGLDTRDSDASARAFVERFGIEYANVVDRDGQLQLLFSDTLPPQAIPSTLVIDRMGRVAGRILGKASESALRGLIEPILDESEPDT
jgi:thiol-disulfide isomerase/thioredoxin